MMGATLYEELMPFDQYGLDVWSILETFDIYRVMPSAQFTAEELGTIGDDAGDMIDYIRKPIQ